MIYTYYKKSGKKQMYSQRIVTKAPELEIPVVVVCGLENKQV